VRKEKTFVNSRKWRRWRTAVQVLALLLFLYLLLGTLQGSTPILPHDLYFRLDPLAGMSAMIASRSWIAPMTLGAIVLLLAVVVGRAWCSWLCPLGTILDWVPARRPRREKLDIPLFWRQGKYLLFLTILLAAMLGSLTLLVLDPITLLFRTFSSVILPVLDLMIEVAETWLYRVGLFQPAVAWFDSLFRGILLTEQPFFLSNLLLLVLFAGVLGLNAIRPRFWCRYLCPLGGLLGLLSGVALIRYKVNNEKCISCWRCAIICPTGSIDPAQKFAANAAECTTCLDCVDTCPTKAISFSAQSGSVTLQHYDQTRRHLLTSLAGAAVGAVILGVVPYLTKAEPRLIRPPGTSEEQLLKYCIRCGECAKICPTGVIQPSVSVGDWEGLWTPRLITRLGYCDYSCNSCGQVCPTGALTKLSLDDKRLVPIGVARIDRTRCIPWAEGRQCIVCEEMCPVPQKAIWLHGGGRGRGRIAGVLHPEVIPDLCIGCGICEYQCPVEGEAAIKVWPTTALMSL
jgi:polyferredoxin